MMENNSDFSKSTVAVLLVLAILISVLSTFTLFNQIKTAESGPVSQSVASTEGNIKLKIVSDKVLPTEAKSSGGQTGHINLVIVPPEG